MHVAESALELIGDDPTVPFDAIAAELASEARLLELLVNDRDRHDHVRESAYRGVAIYPITSSNEVPTTEKHRASSPPARRTRAPGHATR